MPKYVHATLGLDSNPGTLLAPYQTLKKLSDNVASGDTGFVRGGTFGNVQADDLSTDTFRNLANGTPGNYTTIKAYNNEPVTFNINPASIAMVGLNTATYWSFEDIEWVGAGTGAVVKQYFMRSWGGVSDIGSFIKVENCNCHSFSRQIVLLGSFSDCQFLNNDFHDVGGSVQEHGCYVSKNSHRTIIRGNRIYNISGWGIHHYSGSGQADDCRYSDNEIYNYGTVSGSGILMSNGDDNWSWNNIIRDGHANSTSGIQSEFTGFDLPVRNYIFHNVIYNYQTYGLRLEQGSLGIAQNNIILSSTGTPISNNASSTLTTNLTTGVATDIFVDPVTAKDFQLKVGASGAINQGTFDANYSIDRLGLVRSNPPEIGAYEFGAASPLPLSALRRTYFFPPSLAGLK